MPSTLLAERFRTDVFQMTRKDSGAYDVRMNMQWNTRPLGWLPEARPKINRRALRRSHHPRCKRKAKAHVTVGRKNKAHALILKPETSSDLIERECKDENHNTCYISFPRLSMGRNDATTKEGSYHVSEPSKDRSTISENMAATSNELEESAQRVDPSTSADIVVKKVSAYSSDFFKLNKQLSDATVDLGGIKLSDILSNRELHYRSVAKVDTSALVKAAASTSKKSSQESNIKSAKNSDMILKGLQAPMKLKKEEKNPADDVSANRDVTLAGSDVNHLEESAIPSKDVREVWCEDVDEDDHSVPSEVLVDEKVGLPESPQLREDSPTEMKRSTKEYVITEKILQKLQPPVPHVIWPDNKFMTQNTSFIYGSPSRLAPVIVPVHSVDCPISKMFFPSKKGNICPPNSPTKFLTKEYGFYPVERHYGHSGS